MTDETKDEMRESISKSAEETLLSRFESEEPDADEKKDILRQHQNHLVRDTVSKLAVDSETDLDFADVDSYLEVPDVYCFTCGEWVGISGVDLEGTPRSKADAYYLGGPPDDLDEALDTTREMLVQLAKYIMEEVEHVSTTERALELVAQELEHVMEAKDED